MEYTIREAIIADAEALSELNAIEMGYEYSPEETAIKLRAALSRETDRIYVAICDEKVVGYIHACDYDLLFLPSMKNILALAVFSEYCGNGIGSALMARVENWAKSTDACGIRLVSGESRVIAHIFYEKCGFTSDKMQKNYKKMF